MATRFAEVETDKADMVPKHSDDGVLDEVKLKEGESAKVGEVIATLRKAGEAPGPVRSWRRSRKECASGNGARCRRVAGFSGKLFERARHTGRVFR